MSRRTLDVETNAHVAVLRLIRPDDGNPIDEPFLRELGDLCVALNDDTNVRVIVITSEGASFSNPTTSSSDGPTSGQAGPLSCLEAVGQPVICAVNGDALGAGLELALACDVRVASDSAQFSPLPAGEAKRLARVVGRGEALRLLLLGESIDAHEALRIGLVSAVHPRDRLAAEAEALAQRMASRGPIALRYAKEAVRRGLDLPLDEALRMETDLTVILQTTEDRAEGVRAFIEKREPEFKGR